MTSKFVSVVAMIAALPMTLVGAQQAAADVPPAVTLRSFSYAGSGCAADSVTTNLPVDGSEFAITWRSFAAEVGPGVPLRDKRKNCQLLIDLAIPAGWQYSVNSIEYHGEVKIDAGVQAIAGSAYYFQGDVSTVRFNTLFDGPETKVFQVADMASPASQVWSPCGGERALNVNYQVRLDSTSDAALGSLAFGDKNGAASTRIRLDWQRCTVE